MTASVAYPFTAVVGQDQMKLALVLNAINPRLGGVLIRGEKGTAKSTAARGIAALLPPLQVVAGCRFSCDPRPGSPRCPDCLARETLGETPLPSLERPAALIELPIGATEDRVLGTLDLERALKHGERHFEPGLLASANRGLLYVDEVNLLPDHLVDTLLDAAAVGINTVEREGLSFSHPAALVLVGTMNPEEGELRPQLLDRFALTVDVAGMPEPTQRADVVRRRIAYEADPSAFASRWRDAEGDEQARIAAARAALPLVHVGDNLLELIATICTAFDVDGLRADIVIYKAAATLAAYAGRQQVTREDIRRAAELALPHRRRRQPFDQPGLDRDRLDQLIHDHDPGRDDDPGTDADRGSDDDPGRDDDPGSDAEDLGPEHAVPPPPGPDGPASGGTPDAVGEAYPGPASAGTPDAAGEARPDHVFEVGETPPLSPPASAPPRVPSPSMPAPRAARARTTPRVESSTGRHVRSVPATGHARSAAPAVIRTLDVAATLLAAAPHQLSRARADAAAGPPGLGAGASAAADLPCVGVTGCPPGLGTAAGAHGLGTDGDPRSRPFLERFDVRLKVREERARGCTLFVVDASGSMAARRRMAAAKGAVVALLTDAYQARTQVGLIAFRGVAAELVLPLTRSADLAYARLRDLPTGGRTPLALALTLAHATLTRWLAGAASPAATALIVLVSDCRANVALNGRDPRATVALTGGDPHQDVLAAARALRAAGISALVVDTEEGPVRLGLARHVSDALGAHYLRLADLAQSRTPHPVAAAVRHLHAERGA
jgi:magnesium chelatase subunit D